MDAALAKLFDNVFLGPEIHQDNMIFLIFRILFNDPVCAELRNDILCDTIGNNLIQALRHMIKNPGVHHSGFTDFHGQCAGINSVDSRDILFFQIVIECFLTSEIGWFFTILPDAVTEKSRFTFEIIGNDSVIADERKSLDHDLAAIARVSQCFNVSAHAGGEYQLAGPVAGSAEALPFINGPVRKHKICFLMFFHNVAAMTALIVCMRFSASRKTSDCFPSNTSSVTSSASMP